MQLELVMYSIRKLVESKTNAACFATYPPKDSTCFGSQAGPDYHKYIMFTQVFEFTNKQGMTVRCYLYYRNKRTRSLPEFSSCEYGIFTGPQFVSLFKIHIEDLDDKSFAQLVADKVIESIENI